MRGARRLFLVFRNSVSKFWGQFLWMLWIGWARHLGPRPCSKHLGMDFLNVGCWLTHGDKALDSAGDFLAIAEHRLFPARCRDACLSRVA